MILIIQKLAKYSSVPKEVWKDELTKCKICSNVWNRDVNGVTNIYIKFLKMQLIN